ncbi:MAG: tripartite tricarboxylate transporter substrate binding protein [Proteobacteria bacterium]|nr:MAG: tripartite tricarboxylate transporter substrate binding protein [Pseudomonadota bacterium]
MIPAVDMRVRPRPRRRPLVLLLHALFLVLANLSLARAADPADDFPRRPVTLVIPFSAGGSHDLNARVLTKFIGEYLGQPMVVRLVPGSGGRKGARLVAESRADGYTLLFGHNLIDQLQPNVGNLGYDPLEAFAAVWKLNDTRAVVYVRNDSPFTDVRELVEFGLSHPGALVFPHSGRWGFSFTVGAMLMSTTGLRLNLVPYQGGGPVKAAILAGDGDFASAPYGSIRGLRESGKIRVLAVVGPERLAALPDIPSFAELDLPFSGAVMERIVLAPAATPPDRINRLRKAFRRLYDDPGFVALMTQMEENMNYVDGPVYENIRREQTLEYRRLSENLD